MRSRVRGLVAAVSAAAAIGGVLAAPATAEPPPQSSWQGRPNVDVNASCLTTTGGSIQFNAGGPVGPAQQLALTGFNALLKESDSMCLPGTREISVEPCCMGEGIDFTVGARSSAEP
jgi:hypothetical protein